MRKFLIGAAAVASLMTLASAAGEAMPAKLSDAGKRSEPFARPAIGLQPIQFFWDNRQYCWYGDGWNGPGWYRCGFGSPWRSGFGWGGGWGWNGWGGGPRFHGGFARGPRFRGGADFGGGGFRGRGFRGGRSGFRGGKGDFRGGGRGGRRRR